MAFLNLWDICEKLIIHEGKVIKFISNHFTLNYIIFFFIQNSLTKKNGRPCFANLENSPKLKRLQVNELW